MKNTIAGFSLIDGARLCAQHQPQRMESIVPSDDSDTSLSGEAAPAGLRHSRAPLALSVAVLLLAGCGFGNDARADRTVAGMKAANQAGKWTFKAPPGYINKGRTSGPSLVHDPERGPLVKQAFELYATGLHTKQKVLEIVIAAGLQTKAGKPISKQTFHAMLTKPVYAGWIQVDGWGERVRGDFEPLVSQELFDTVQALLNGKRANVTPRLRSHPDFPLRHFVNCGCCGKPLTASWQKGRRERYGYYWCPNSRCRVVRVRKTDLERSFEEFLKRMQPKPQ